VLKGAGLVRDQREGTRRLYSLDGAGLSVLRTYLETFWDSALAAFKEAVDEDGGTPLEDEGGTR
jgi:DNA-binding transcriptional ArsR family regulator